MNIQRTLQVARQFSGVFRRNIGMSAIVSKPDAATQTPPQNMDPVQKLFYDTVVNYRNQSNKLGGGPVDAGADYQQLVDETVNRLKKVYGVTDPKAFPEMKFTEPDLDQDSVEDF